MAVVALLSAYGEVLTPDQALDRAIGQVSLMSTAAQRPRLVATRSAGNLPAVYVFAEGNGKGYLVLSADDKAEPVLGYSNDGCFDAGSMNPAMLWWLDEYATQIQCMRTDTDRKNDLPGGDAPRHEAIAPLLTTRWGQSAPYSNMCPPTCVTGCVATAMAQILNYHKMPVGKGSGSNSVVYNGETYTFNFAEESFDWNNMLDSYSDIAYDEEQADAVAKLMFACGVGVNMKYGLFESSAVADGRAFVDYFGFDQGIASFYRKYNTIDDWNELIYNQLKDYGPVLYSGRGTDGEHTFVCDGYDGDDYFHINWGWNGNFDGYYRLTALTPETGGDIDGVGYNMDQYVVGNICARRPDSCPYYTVFAEFPLSVEPSATTVGQSFLIKCDFSSLCNRMSYYIGKSIDFGFNLTPVDGGETMLFRHPAMPIFPRFSFDYSVQIPSGTPDGIYKLTAVWKFSDTDGWNSVLIPFYNPQYVIVKVSGDDVSAFVPDVATVRVELKSIDSPVIEGRRSSFTLSLTNDSQCEYADCIRAVVLSGDGSTEISYGGYLWVDLRPGESDCMDYVSSFLTGEHYALEAGRYRIVWRDMSGNVVSPVYDLNVGRPPIINVALKSIDRSVFVGRKSSFTLALTNDSKYEAIDNIRAVILTDDDSEIIGWGEYFVADLKPGESVDINYESSFIINDDGDPLTAGYYHIAWRDMGDNIISPVYDIVFEDCPTRQGTIEVNSFSAIKQEVVSGDDVQFTANLTCIGDDFMGHLYVDIYPESGTRLIGIRIPDICIKAGETQDISFSVPSGNLEVDKRYVAWIFDEYADECISDNVPFVIVSSAAVESVDIGNDVIDREIYSLDGRLVSTPDPSPGLYIVRDLYGDGTVKTSKMRLR